MRGGRVLESNLSDLLTEVDTSSPDTLFRLAIQMLNDLGIEVDETFDSSDLWGSTPQSLLPYATDGEAELQDEALQYLKSLLQNRNDPSRIFAKEGYVYPLLPQEAEVQIAQRMEQSIDAAIEYLSEWPFGLRALLAICDEVKDGTRSLRSVRSNKTSEGEEPDGEKDDLSSKASHNNASIEEAAEVGDESDETSDQLEEFIRLSGALHQLVDFSDESTAAVTPKVRQTLCQMRLAGSFLSTLRDPADKSPAAQGFSSNTDKFLAASYNTMLTRLGTTPARLRALKDEMPVSRKVTKTDLAKYLMAWEQHPDLVSLGSQKNFDRFMDRVSEQCLNGWLPNVDDYKVMIAKAKLYRDVEKLIRSMFPAFKANVAAYLVSLLSRKLGDRLSLERVWLRQGISSELSEQLRVWAQEVNNRLHASANGRMVSEWAKKVECKEAVLEAAYSAPAKGIPEVD